MEFSTQSERETEAFGERLARHLEPGTVIGLVGPLGAGKTALVRGIARGLGVEDGVVHSPTFLTATEYDGRMRLAHIDLYRHEETLPHPDWLAEILDGLDDAGDDRVAVVEWFERLGADRPDDVLRIDLDYGADDTQRTLSLAATGPRSQRLLAALTGASEAAA
ncbi:MAG TPA: tRNA (adenosine(37)-N6)-threonylcarbamoyltransferase complex ATPase subunit type 1 TsaE [Candidatus Binatia bacterium]